MLDNKTFKIVVDSTPLISIDILLKMNDKFLLGKRINKPAQGYWFLPGGRIYKNETFKKAMTRIIKDELNIELKYAPKFIGVYQHFYSDSAYQNVSTHYVNLAYEYEVNKIGNLPTIQHS